MITLTRRQVQRLRTVFRRSVLGLPSRGAHPPLVFSVEDGQVGARYRYAHLALEHSSPTSAPASEPVPLPLEALAEFEGRDDTPVTIEAVAPDRTDARWSDRGIPQAREFAVPALPDQGPFLDLPKTWVEVPGDLLTALAEATATAAESDSRYALSCLQLRASGEVIGTDGRQVLIRGGFAFPWTDDLLIHRTPLFNSRELPRDRTWSIARTATQVVLRCEPWTIFLEIATSARYPNVEAILPPSDAMTTRLRLDPGDATFLADGLSRLPGGDAEHAPVTVELNGRIAVRARGSNSDPATELILSRSSSSGTAVPFSTNREFLTRALRLGFREVELTDAKSPIVCRSGAQVYAWQPLDPDAVIEASEASTRIESTQQRRAHGSPPESCSKAFANRAGKSANSHGPRHRSPGSCGSRGKPPGPPISRHTPKTRPRGVDVTKSRSSQTSSRATTAPPPRPQATPTPTLRLHRSRLPSGLRRLAPWPERRRQAATLQRRQRGNCSDLRTGRSRAWTDLLRLGRSGHRAGYWDRGGRVARRVSAVLSEVT